MRRFLLFSAVLVAACSGGDDTAETFKTTVDQPVDGPADAVSGDVTEDVEVAEPVDSESPSDSEDTSSAPATTAASSSTVPATTAPTTVPVTTRAPTTTVATQPTGPAKADSTTPTLAPEDTTDTDGSNAADTEQPAEPVAPQVGDVDIRGGRKHTTISVEPQGEGRWRVCYEVEGDPDLLCVPVTAR